MDNRARIRAFVLLLRDSGLWLQDAVTLEKIRLRDGNLFLYTQKTGTPVYVPLPPFVAAAILAIRPAGDDRFFWSGVGHPRSCMSVWDRSLRRVFSLAGVEGGHAHRFRDTFAVSLLERAFRSRTFRSCSAIRPWPSLTATTPRGSALASSGSRNASR